ncbi:MAG TPA: hypothetical protein VF519_14020 [Mycobacteriales bacterium]|jgi:hypothetical protein
MRWFRRRRAPRPLVPGELIDTNTPEGRARFDEVFGHLPKRRSSPEPLPWLAGIDIAQIVIDQRGPD